MALGRNFAACLCLMLMLPPGAQGAGTTKKSAEGKSTPVGQSSPAESKPPKWVSATGIVETGIRPDRATASIRLIGVEDKDRIGALASVRSLKPRALSAIRLAMGREPDADAWTEGVRSARDCQHGCPSNTPMVAEITAKLQIPDAADARDLAWAAMVAYGRTDYPGGNLAILVHYDVLPESGTASSAHQGALEDARAKAMESAHAQGLALDDEWLPGPYRDEVTTTDTGWTLKTSVNVIWKAFPMDPNSGTSP